MPRYFFHVRDGQEYIDSDGTELDDPAAARIYALQVVTQILGTPSSDFWNGEGWHFHVEDDAGSELFKLSFHASVKPST